MGCILQCNAYMRKASFALHLLWDYLCITLSQVRFIEEKKYVLAFTNYYFFCRCTEEQVSVGPKKESCSSFVYHRQCGTGCNDKMWRCITIIFSCSLLSVNNRQMRERLTASYEPNNRCWRSREEKPISLGQRSPSHSLGNICSLQQVVHRKSQFYKRQFQSIW